MGVFGNALGSGSHRMKEWRPPVESVESDPRGREIAIPGRPAYRNLTKDVSMGSRQRGRGM